MIGGAELQVSPLHSGPYPLWTTTPGVGTLTWTANHLDLRDPPDLHSRQANPQVWHPTHTLASPPTTDTTGTSLPDLLEVDELPPPLSSSKSDPTQKAPIRDVREDEIPADVTESTSSLAVTVPLSNMNALSTTFNRPAHLIVLPDHILSLTATLNHPPPNDVPNKVPTPLIFQMWRDQMVELASELCLEEGNEWEDMLYSGLSLKYVLKLMPMLDRIIACMAEFRGLSKFWAVEATHLKHEWERIIAVYQAPLHHWCAVRVGVVPASEILV
ncbi:hypothetical protein JAAARDRAFT_48964 [Jaapia argillacea MUCL 33604]|uniref:Uncharacterized protein n=1 Tax=Jaapia argillacea MUCL 33604 TaxID=933084 RepID=A0A067PWJ6_9AGAM|nr:hypothetical protein JAAARDRAFT_48964 [Jaapia argillacea MUCL 33604]